MVILKKEEPTAVLQDARRHICCIYERQQEMQETIVSFCKQKHCKEEKNIFIMEPRLENEIYDCLSQDLGSTGVETSPNSLIFMNSNHIYSPNDDFDPFQTIRVLIHQVREARLEGFKSIRCIIDMNWSAYDNWTLLDYETRINKYLIPQYPCTALCLYNIKRVNPRLLKNIIAQHPEIINRGHIINNRYYNPPTSIIGHRSGEQEIQALLEAISIEQCPAINHTFKYAGQINNCYRAILAIVNYLGSICNRKEYLTDIYQDLSEIAYYIMDNNKYCLFKGIEELTILLNDLENEFKIEDREKAAVFKLTLDEIRTHMQYLRIQFSQGQ